MANVLDRRTDKNRHLELESSFITNNILIVQFMKYVDLCEIQYLAMPFSNKIEYNTKNRL